jgi:hypothetical protein
MDAKDALCEREEEVGRLDEGGNKQGRKDAKEWSARSRWPKTDYEMKVVDVSKRARKDASIAV